MANINLLNSDFEEKEETARGNQQSQQEKKKKSDFEEKQVGIRVKKNKSEKDQRTYKTPIKKFSNVVKGAVILKVYY